MKAFIEKWKIFFKIIFKNFNLKNKKTDMNFEALLIKNLNFKV